MKKLLLAPLLVSMLFAENIALAEQGAERQERGIVMLQFEAYDAVNPLLVYGERELRYLFAGRVQKLLSATRFALADALRESKIFDVSTREALEHGELLSKARLILVLNEKEPELNFSLPADPSEREWLHVFGRIHRGSIMIETERVPPGQ